MVCLQLGDRVQNGQPEEQLYLIYVRTSLGRFLVYLDTTTQHLVYYPLISNALEPAVNYSSKCSSQHCKKRIVILTIVVCYLVVDDNTLHAWTQLIAEMVWVCGGSWSRMRKTH